MAQSLAKPPVGANGVTGLTRRNVFAGYHIKILPPSEIRTPWVSQGSLTAWKQTPFFTHSESDKSDDAKMPVAAADWPRTVQASPSGLS